MPPAKSKNPFGKAPGLKKPTFGGKARTKDMPPDKKTLESFGGARTRQKPFETRVEGNKEFGFIQATPKQATGAMMGRALPKLGKTGTRKDSRKQFKPKAGGKVF